MITNMTKTKNKKTIMNKLFASGNLKVRSWNVVIIGLLILVMGSFMKATPQETIIITAQGFMIWAYGWYK